MERSVEVEEGKGNKAEARLKVHMRRG